MIINKVKTCIKIHIHIFFFERKKKYIYIYIYINLSGYTLGVVRVGGLGSL